MGMNTEIYLACARAAKDIHLPDIEHGSLDEETIESILDDTTYAIYNQIIQVVRPTNHSLVIIDWTQKQVSVE